jgi:dihydroorotate dehydrogenase (fumarate)
MADLTAKYMGIELSNPFVVGACSLTADMGAIKKIEESGAGALVIKSLFEEQIELERYKLDEDLHLRDDWHAEMTSIYPEVEHSGPDEHLMWVEKAKNAVDIPVVASLNAVHEETWVEWAQKLEQTGVDGLELNFFATPTSFDKTGKDIEASQVEAIKAVKSKVKIPVSVKLSEFYTSPLDMVKQMDGAGADGFVLFNRLFHPSFNIEKEEAGFPFNLSSSSDHRLSLRFVGLLAGNVDGSLCASNGIHTGEDAIEALLAGASVFQAVSTLYKNSLDQIGVVLKEIDSWMDKKGYSSLDDFRGKLSVAKADNKFMYHRAQYVKMLLRADDYIKRPNII